MVDWMLDLMVPLDGALDAGDGHLMVHFMVDT